MGTFILKRKLYSDDKKSDGWSTVGKIATGTAATVGATALGLRMGRKGRFGTGIQTRVGNLYQNVGAKMANSGSNLLRGVGTGLGKQGNIAKAQASTTNAINRLEKSGKLKGLTEDAIDNKRRQLYDTKLKGQERTLNAKVQAAKQQAQAK